MTTHPPLASRAVRLTLSSLACSGLLLATMTNAEAQSPHRARMSQDLEQRLLTGDTEVTSVIVTGSSERIARVAARHGLAVREAARDGCGARRAGGHAGGVGRATARSITCRPITWSKRTWASPNQTIGADVVQAGGWAPGIGAFTGAGIGVAVIDTGVAMMPELRGRIIASHDFTDERGLGIDQHGHGTHVAGIIAASGVNQFDGTRGVAPGANIISLKVLDAQGKGLAANVIKAIDWVVANRLRYNIRVINMSLGGAVRQGWRDDPICQAVERAYRSGVVVVASAGNYGKTADGRLDIWRHHDAGYLALRNHRWRAEHQGNSVALGRRDRELQLERANALRPLIKPDLVAPGNKILGLAAPGSTLAREHPELVIGAGRQVASCNCPERAWRQR